MPVTGVEPTVPRPLDFPPRLFLAGVIRQIFLDLFCYTRIIPGGCGASFARGYNFPFRLS